MYSIQTVGAAEGCDLLILLLLSVEASLLAKAVYLTPRMLNVPKPSRSGSLPEGQLRDAG
jgi:hypothetical protein